MRRDGKDKTPATVEAGGTPGGAAISYASLQKAAASKAFLESHYGSRLKEARSGVTRVVGPRERLITVDDFHLIKLIGRGAFGEVFVCQRKDDPTGYLYALKRMRKTDMLRKKQIMHVRSEKDILSQAAAKNPWVVCLYASFQDKQYLYMLMEYMPGGDMITWLCDKAVFDLESTRFYIAELCMAVASVHAMNFVHRDIKPDNILFGIDGHIKLSDFGLSKRFENVTDTLMDYDASDIRVDPGDGAAGQHAAQPEQTCGRSSTRVPEGTDAHPSSVLTNEASPRTRQAGVRHVLRSRLFDSIVGSAGYIAPEILLRQWYGVSCDWWSVGVIMYEMLYGRTPFLSQDTDTTNRMIVRWREYLRFPPNPTVPDVAIDFMRRLLCDPQDRMDFETIRRHPFFDGLDLDHIRETRAAYQPVLSNPLDTKYFPDVDSDANAYRVIEDKTVREVDPCGVLFADFRFNVNSKRNKVGDGD